MLFSKEDKYLVTCSMTLSFYFMIFRIRMTKVISIWFVHEKSQTLSFTLFFRRLKQKSSMRVASIQVLKGSFQESPLG